MKNKQRQQDFYGRLRDVGDFVRLQPRMGGPISVFEVKARKDASEINERNMKRAEFNKATWNEGYLPRSIDAADERVINYYKNSVPRPFHNLPWVEKQKWYDRIGNYADRLKLKYGYRLGELARWYMTSPSWQDYDDDKIEAMEDPKYNKYTFWRTHPYRIIEDKFQDSPTFGEALQQVTMPNYVGPMPNGWGDKPVTPIFYNGRTNLKRGRYGNLKNNQKYYRRIFI